ncbi:MAG: glycyl-radical enzyme activating protein [Dehalococcoidales bacterium]|nr:glycyl-radical enzyme activating protein [Dehalococcoidales bacterium]
MADITENKADRGFIFNIQHYSIHDGPGIRTSVFLKGCFLSCVWCQNPESQSIEPELFFFEERCTGCGNCVAVCPVQAVQVKDGKSFTDRTICNGSGKCALVCLNDARSIMGKEMAAHEVFHKVKGDELFYKRSNGGVTLTGGEPLFQADFSRTILSLCRQAGIHTAIETCGFADWEIFKEVLRYTDLVLFDLKQMNSEKHREYTGVPNELILENVRKIVHDLKIPVRLRIPVIPGHNDSLEDIHDFAKFISGELDTSLPVHFLAYHRLGESKYERLGITDKNVTITPPSNEQMSEIQQIAASYGLETYIGG